MRKDWIETEATIANIYEERGAEGSIFSFVFTYKVGDGYFGGTFTGGNLGQHYEGERIPVRYDPADPNRNDLVEKEKLTNWIYAVLFVAFGLWCIYSLLWPAIK